MREGRVNSVTNEAGPSGNTGRAGLKGKKAGRKGGGAHRHMGGRVCIPGTRGCIRPSRFRPTVRGRRAGGRRSRGSGNRLPRILGTPGVYWQEGCLQWRRHAEARQLR